MSEYNSRPKQRRARIAWDYFVESAVDKPLMMKRRFAEPLKIRTIREQKGVNAMSDDLKLFLGTVRVAIKAHDREEALSILAEFIVQHGGKAADDGVEFLSHNLDEIPD